MDTRKTQKVHIGRAGPSCRQTIQEQKKKKKTKDKRNGRKNNSLKVSMSEYDLLSFVV